MPCGASGIARNESLFIVCLFGIMIIMMMIIMMNGDDDDCYDYGYDYDDYQKET